MPYFLVLTIVESTIRRKLNVGTLFDTTNQYILVYISSSCLEGVVYVHSENTSGIEEGVISLLHPYFHSFTFLRHGLTVQDIESSTAAMENLKGTILSSSDSDGLQIEYPLSVAVQDIAGSALNAIFLIISRACRFVDWCS